MRLSGLRQIDEVERQGAAEERNGYKWDREQEDASAAKTIDEEQRHDGEQEVGGGDGEGGKSRRCEAEEGEEGR